MSGPETTDQHCIEKNNSVSAAVGTARVVNSRKVLHLLAGVIASAAALSMGGCAESDSHDVGKNIGDYLNLRNSFLDPSQVGRFDKTNPWGKVKPVKWPILDQLDVDDDPMNHWASAGDPTSADLVPEVKEYTLAPSDTISVSVFELLSPGADFVQQRRVNELGYVNLQSIGPVLVSGLTPSQLESKIAQTLIEKRILPAPDANTPGPQVNVQVLDSRQHVFSFLGSVSRPGTYNVLAADFRLLDAIALAGDIPVQPGMDYLYVIRQIPYTQKSDGSDSSPATGGTLPGTPVKPTTSSGNPLGTLEQIEKGAQTEPTTVPPATIPSTPSTPTTPTTGPQSESGLPALLRPLPTATVVSDGKSLGTVAAADGLDAALGVPSTAPSPPAVTGATTQAATSPATVVTTQAEVATAPAVSTAPAAATAKVATTNPADLKLLENAVSPVTANQGTRFVFIDGRWVPIPAHGPTTNPAIAVNQGGVPVPTTNEISVAPPADKLVQQRIIRIPLAALREGVSKYNIVVRAGDILNVPPVEPGEFYLMGNIARPGVYALTGRKVTLKMAVAAGGNLGALAIPRRCDLIRRIGNDQEVTVQVNMQKIFDGEQPDIFLKANDVVNIGTDLVAPFLLITRNAYRASYGYGFVYDRNLYTGTNSTNTSN